VRYILEDGDEQVDQQDVGHQQVAGHDGRDDPGARLAGGQHHHGAIICGDVLTTGGWTTQPGREHTHTHTGTRMSTRETSTSWQSVSISKTKDNLCKERCLGAQTCRYAAAAD